MANLAIKGHATKGDEVIEILGILGGSNAFGHIGNNPRAIYYIDETYKNFITCSETKKVCDCVIFTLEEFIEKFTYKVGDKVVAYAEGCLASFTIQDMRWNHKLNKVEYKICSSWLDDSLIMRRCKEETMEKEISGAIINRFICLEGYDFYDDKGNIIDTKEITMKKKQPKYPNTYEECCEVLGINELPYMVYTWNRNEEVILQEHQISTIIKLDRFRKLLFCRDAYWKIAEDWKPNFNDETEKFIITNYRDSVYTNTGYFYNKVLSFPTEEMRDAFYENFKELIEECKELL